MQGWLSIKEYSSSTIVLLSFLLTSTITPLFIFTLNPSPAQAQSTSSDLLVQVDSVLELSLNSCNSTNNSVVEVNIEPTSTGTFKSNCQDVTVNTNAPGYTLTAKSSTSTMNYQNPTTITPTPTIASTTNTITTPNTLSNDTWGFAVQDRLNFTGQTYTVDNASNTYAALPITDTTIYSTTTFPLPVTDHTFFYAARLTPATMAGSYAATVMYTAVGEVPTPVPTYPKVENGASFQDVTININRTCSALPIYDSSNPDPASTVVMTDNRNGQDYRVRRLQDGKCWMIDNLKLELTNGMTLSPTNTNIVADTTVYFTQDNTNTGATLTGLTGNFTTSGYMTRDGTDSITSPNLNTWRQADPSNTTRCVNNTGTNTTNAYSPDSLTGCGYFYNWYAATAGTGTQSITIGNAPGSICPAGWRLPYEASNNDFGVLNNSMLNGYPSSSATTNTAESRANWLPSGAFQGSLAGNYYIGLSSQGYIGYYWGSRSSSAPFAYGMYFLHNVVVPGGASYYKYYGMGVRCTI